MHWCAFWSTCLFFLRRTAELCSAAKPIQYCLSWPYRLSVSRFVPVPETGSPAASICSVLMRGPVLLVQHCSWPRLQHGACLVRFGGSFGLHLRIDAISGMAGACSHIGFWLVGRHLVSETPTGTTSSVLWLYPL